MRRNARRWEVSATRLLETETDESEDDFAAKVEALDAQITALAEHEQYRSEDKAIAGAFVCLGHDGKPRIERGYAHAKDVPETEAAAEAEREDADAPKLEYSEKLVAELTAHRTAALRNELAQNPTIAIVALTYAMVLQCFYDRHEASCLRAGVGGAALSTHAQGIGDSTSETAIRERHETQAADAA